MPIPRAFAKLTWHSQFGSGSEFFFLSRATCCVSRVLAAVVFAAEKTNRAPRSSRSSSPPVVAVPSPVVVVEIVPVPVRPSCRSRSSRSSSRRREVPVHPRSLLPSTASRSKLLLVTMPPPTPSNRLALRLAKVCCA